jgi:hypothetical protein
MTVELEDLERIGSRATDQFRLETLPQYLVPEEDEEFTAWRRGDRTLPTPDSSPWLAHIRDTTAAGVRWWRVRVLDYPLTEYSAYELHGYQANAAAGEDIFVADRAWHGDLASLNEDFWIFDHEVVVRMIYDEEGRFIRPELAAAADLARCLDIRAVAVRHSISIAAYLRQIEPRLIA